MVLTGPHGSTTPLELIMESNENTEQADNLDTTDESDVEGHRRAAGRTPTRRTPTTSRATGFAKRRGRTADTEEDDDVEGHRFKKA